MATITLDTRTPITTTPSTTTSSATPASVVTFTSTRTSPLGEASSSTAARTSTTLLETGLSPISSGPCTGCQVVIAVSTTTSGPTSALTSYAVYYALRVETTISGGSQCVVSSGSTSNLAPARSVVIPADANPTFFSSAGSSIVHDIGSPTCPGGTAGASVVIETALTSPSSPSLTSYSAAPTSSTGNMESPTGGVGPTIFGLLVIPIVLFLALLAIGTTCWVHRRRRRRRAQAAAEDASSKPVAEEEAGVGFSQKLELAAGENRPEIAATRSAEELLGSPRSELWAGNARQELRAIDGIHELSADNVRSQELSSDNTRSYEDAGGTNTPKEDEKGKPHMSEVKTLKPVTEEH